jgi:flagellar protein FliT
MADSIADMLDAYQELAELTRQALSHTRARDWESYASLQEREAVLERRLQGFDLAGKGKALQAQIAGLIRQVLEDQREMRALLEPWRAEIAAQLRSTGSSRMLAKAYRGA